MYRNFTFLKPISKQCSALKIVGTIGGITFYKMNGKYYCPEQSSLTGSFGLNCFEISREIAHRFGKANITASRVYRWLEKEQHYYDLFCLLKKFAILLSRPVDLHFPCFVVR